MLFINEYLCTGFIKPLASPFSQIHVTYVNNPKNIERLTLIFMKSLDLDVKHGVRVHLDAQLALHE